MAAVRHLAGVIGPRHGTSPEFRRAAGWVAGELGRLGYDVRRQRFPVPGGDSWGVPVAAGTSLNVVAVAPGTDLTRPHLVVGAHLDTVPRAPGAEDNASGVGTLLAVAQALAERRARLPVVLVAFGAEEPRGPSDDDHHYGSRAYVAALTAAQRRGVRGMVSLDRVGVGDVVPVGAASGQPTALVEAAERAGVPVAPETGQRSSDHWSFVRAGLPGLRIGSTPYAAYHSPQDVPAVVDRDQLERAGRLVLAWLSGRG
jgi:Iap family predicted aminopeptidase